MLFAELQPGTKFKNVHAIINRKKVYTKLPKREIIGFDDLNQVPIFANTVSGKFFYDFDDEVSVKVIT